MNILAEDIRLCTANSDDPWTSGSMMSYARGQSYTASTLSFDIVRTHAVFGSGKGCGCDGLLRTELYTNDGQSFNFHWATASSSAYYIALYNKPEFHSSFPNSRSTHDMIASDLQLLKNQLH